LSGARRLGGGLSRLRLRDSRGPFGDHPQYQPLRAASLRMSLYAAWLRPLLFRLDAEQAHKLALEAAARLGRHVLSRQLGDDHDPWLQCRIAGLNFPNPLGLAAGFDKSG